LERFDYWLNTFRYMRANAQVNCTWHLYNQAIAKVKSEKDRLRQPQLARYTALPLRKELVAQVAAVHQHLLSAITTYGGMGTVTNWQQHLQPKLLEEPGTELAQLLGQALPPDAVPAGEYRGPVRLFVPNVRTVLVSGEPLEVEVIVLGGPADVTLAWRPLGETVFRQIPVEHVARGVYRVRLAASSDGGDLEYYVQAKTAASSPRFPPTAPELNQTVVVVPAQR
jgi:hypothetical protein